MYGDMADWGSVRKICEPRAGYKIIVETFTDQILGVHRIGPNAAETINLFALATNFGIGLKGVKSALSRCPPSRPT